MNKLKIEHGDIIDVTHNGCPFLTGVFVTHASTGEKDPYDLYKEARVNYVYPTQDMNFILKRKRIGAKLYLVDNNGELGNEIDPSN